METAVHAGIAEKIRRTATYFVESYHWASFFICRSEFFAAIFVLGKFRKREYPNMKKLLSLALALLLTLGTAACLASCKKEGRDISGAKNLADLAGARIAAQAGTFHEDALSQIENVQGSTYSEFDDMLIALRSGSIDGYIAEEPTALSVCYKDQTLDYIHLKNNDTGFTATDADTAIAIGCAKGSSLVARINTVLATITQAERSSLMEKVVAISAGETVTLPAVSASSGSNGTLRVAMECAYDPFNWTQRDNSNDAVPISGQGSEGLYANGYDVQIARRVAAALDMTLEIYAVEWDNLMLGVKAGTYDAIIAGMSPTAERSEEIDFTDIYYSSNLVIIYKKQ